MSSSITPISALETDAHLLICCACGTQFPRTAQQGIVNGHDNNVSSTPGDCLICADDRQFVPPATGQRWTTLHTMASGEREADCASSVHGPARDGSEKHSVEIVADKEDPRMSYLVTKSSFGIAQTPILLETCSGAVLWDCSAFISNELVTELKARKVKALAISHPHFYTTSLTWSRALGVPLFIAAADREWFQRLPDVQADEIVWYDEVVDVLGGDGKVSSIKAIRCGGHFPGSACLYWDRSQESGTQTETSVSPPRSGLLLCADTAMVQPHQRGFTFQWSVPNMIPMNPKDIIALYRRLEPYAFEQASSTWQNRFVRNGAKQALKRSVRQQLASQGIRWNEETDELHFTLGTGAQGGLEP